MFRRLHGLGRRWRLCASLLAASTWGFTLSSESTAGPAESAGHVAVLPIEGSGEIDENTRNSALAGLISGLRRGGLEIVDAQQIAAANPEDPGCESASCRGSLSAIAGLTAGEGIYLLHTTLVRVEADFQITLALQRPDDGVTVATVEAECEICGEAELAERMADAGASMQPRIVALRPKSAVVEVAGIPAGATVYVDGEAAGESPLVLELSPGDHLLRVEKSGHVAQERRWNSAAGVRERISYDLAPAARPGPHPAIGWTLSSVGLGALAAGVTLLVLDGRPHSKTCEGLADVNGRCPNRFATGEAGIVFAAAGGAALVAGIVLLAYSYRARGASRIGLVPAGMELRF